MTTKKFNVSPRRRAREFAVQAVYAWLVNNESEVASVEAHIRSDEEFSQADLDWFRKLFNGVCLHSQTLREQFVGFLDRPLVELSPVEHAILLIGSYELMHEIEVPYKVVINESVELAKAFGGTDGFKFVNGVLDKLALKLRSTEVKGAAK